MASLAPHDQFMALALEQASYAQLFARPNPAVGCVLVKHNQVVEWDLPSKPEDLMPK